MDSKLAHALLDGLTGIEIGGSAHNAFNIPFCKNVDYTDSLDTVFKQEEIKLCGRALPVDIVANAWELPFEDESLDFVLSSHVIEHCWDVIGTVKEWLRVVKPGGYIYMDIPHKERTFDKDRERTSHWELVNRNLRRVPEPEVDLHSHYSVWITEDWRELCIFMKWSVYMINDVSDKVPNGFTVVLRK